MFSIRDLSMELLKPILELTGYVWRHGPMNVCRVWNEMVEHVWKSCVRHEALGYHHVMPVGCPKTYNTWLQQSGMNVCECGMELRRCYTCTRTHCNRCVGVSYVSPCRGGTLTVQSASHRDGFTPQTFICCEICGIVGSDDDHIVFCPRHAAVVSFDYGQVLPFISYSGPMENCPHCYSPYVER